MFYYGFGAPLCPMIKTGISCCKAYVINYRHLCIPEMFCCTWYNDTRVDTHLLVQAFRPRQRKLKHKRERLGMIKTATTNSKTDLQKKQRSTS